MTTSRELVATLGPHPSRALGIDLASDTGLWHWLVAARLLSAPRERALAAFRALLAAEDGADVATLARCDATRLALTLAKDGLPQPERAALTLARAADALERRHAGSLAALLAQAGDLASAGEALVGLAPGLGSATALRFLRALRTRASAAQDAPLAPPALAAAACLGWIPPDADPEAAPALLAQRLAEEASAADLLDVEAALEALGAASCARARAARCPLAAACPLRYRERP